MTYAMYLDDVRNPEDTYGGHNPALVQFPYQQGSHTSWVVCRDYDAAVKTFLQRGWPSMVSFDHDLGDNIPTGMDFARFLVEQDMDSDGMPDGFRYFVHSANPCGSANITGLLTGYLKFKGVQ